MVVILVVAMLVIGPDKMPYYMKQLGKGMTQLRKATAGLNEDVQENIVRPLNEAQQPLREAMEPLQETADQINDAIESTNKVLHPRKYASVVTKESLAKKKAMEWTCANCGHVNTSAFCTECGCQKPAEEAGAGKKEEGDGKDEDRTSGTDHCSADCADSVWTNTDSKAQEDADRQQEEL